MNCLIPIINIDNISKKNNSNSSRNRLAQRENTRFVIFSFSRDCSSTMPHAKDFFQVQSLSFRRRLAMYFTRMLDMESSKMWGQPWIAQPQITQTLSQESWCNNIPLYEREHSQIKLAPWSQDQILYITTLLTNTATYTSIISNKTPSMVE